MEVNDMKTEVLNRISQERASESAGATLIRIAFLNETVQVEEAGSLPCPNK